MMDEDTPQDAAGQGKRTRPWSREELDALFRSVLPELQELAPRIVPDPDVADDVVQEAANSLYLALEGDPGAWDTTPPRKALLWSVLKRRMVDELRKVRSGEAATFKYRVELELTPQEAPPADERLEARQRMAATLKSVRRLPKRTRFALYAAMDAGESETQQGIAARLGVQLSTYKTQLAQARRFVREKLVNYRKESE